MLKTINIFVVYAAIGMFLLPQSLQAEESDEYYTNIYASENQENYQATPNNDQFYFVPSQYHGKTYPDEQEGAIGYHGTKKSSEADNPNPTNYYYYYY